MGERPLEAAAAPLLVTNMSGKFLESRVSSTGVAKYGFTSCLPEEEDALLTSLFLALEEKRWGRCATLTEAVDWMSGKGLKAHYAVVPFELLDEACGAPIPEGDVQKLMSERGYVAECLGGVQILAANTPKSLCLVTALPDLVGYYTRIDDRLGVMLTRADISVCLVG